jgi:hypothetical protein
LYNVVLLQKVVLLPTVGSGLKYIEPHASDADVLGSEVISEKYTGLGVGVLLGVVVGVGVTPPQSVSKTTFEYAAN